jgi:hypothetical protein
LAIRGFLEFASASAVRGWAYDSDSPSTHLEIIVRIDNEFCTAASANISRSDLAEAGFGDGSHGFNIDLTLVKVPPSSLSALEVHAVSGSDIVKLPRAARTSNRIVNLLSDAQISLSDELQFPVFILGPARSGTSAVTLGLLESTRYEGSGEGHLLPLAHAILSAADKHYQSHNDIWSDTMLGRVPGAAFQKLIRRAFVQLVRDLYPTGYWLDKTPTVEMVRAAPLMRELWPNARFIFMKRRVIENVLSRRRKFAADSIEMHYSDWVAVMSEWLVVREQLTGVTLEIDHRQLVLDPRGVGLKIVEFLNIPEPAAVRLDRYLSGTRPEQTDENFGAIYTFDDLSLTEIQAREMKAVCNPLMLAYGYDYSEHYYLQRECASDATLGGGECSAYRQ